MLVILIFWELISWLFLSLVLGLLLFIFNNNLFVKICVLILMILFLLSCVIVYLMVFFINGWRIKFGIKVFFVCLFILMLICKCLLKCIFLIFKYSINVWIFCFNGIFLIGFVLSV